MQCLHTSSSWIISVIKNQSIIYVQYCVLSLYFKCSHHKIPQSAIDIIDPRAEPNISQIEQVIRTFLSTKNVDDKSFRKSHDMLLYHLNKLLVNKQLVRELRLQIRTEMIRIVNCSLLEQILEHISKPECGIQQIDAEIKQKVQVKKIIPPSPKKKPQVKSLQQLPPLAVIDVSQTPLAYFNRLLIQANKDMIQYKTLKNALIKMNNKIAYVNDRIQRMQSLQMVLRRIQKKQREVRVQLEIVDMI
ncbi:Hypothetical_protein [Hexamita inflata]|uniref:Hypothetical_protein n=1 Tax=Hexamita inflata TaxID=28002 RepID=A0AA86R220_9EUKA|nr:Hypothetical protein HINF_LOCUS52432 [Hexamita inflata]